MPDATGAPRRRPQRLTAGLVALGSSAVLAIYAAGYATTQPATEEIARQSGATVVAPADRNGPTPTPIALIARPAQSPPLGAAAPPAAPTAIPMPERPETFQDGTYTGKSTGRHGGLEVSVVIIRGHIVSADITLCQTRYSCSLIDGLRAQVIARQSATVDAVSGATDSVRAYQSAIASALAQAR